MKETENSVAYRTGELAERRSSGKVRVLPRVTFGLGAALLAGVVVVTVSPAPTATGAAATVATTAGLGAAVNAVTGNGMLLTTCCGSVASALQVPD